MGHASAHGASAQWWQPTGADIVRVVTSVRRGTGTSFGTSWRMRHAAMQVLQPMHVPGSAMTSLRLVG